MLSEKNELSIMWKHHLEGYLSVTDKTCDVRTTRPDASVWGFQGDQTEVFSRNGPQTTDKNSEPENLLD